MIRSFLFGFLGHQLKVITNTFPLTWGALSNNGIGLVLIAESTCLMLDIMGMKKSQCHRVRVAIYAGGFVTGLGVLLGYRVNPHRRTDV